MYNKIKPLLFKLDPETAHHLAEIALSTARRCPLFFNWMTDKYFVDDEKLHQNIWGLNFINPVGTAGGFDKNAKMIQALPSLGFGWGELGAVTPKPQEGNQKPRVWRHIEEESLQNAFGFNNDGVAVIANRLDKIYPFVLPLAMNIGKNKTTPDEEAINDYKILVEKLKEGIELTVKSFNTAFEKHSITEVEYDEFNPDYHNAVMKVDSDDVESGQIVQVLQKGYMYKDRLLREAMVSVAN